MYALLPALQEGLHAFYSATYLYFLSFAGEIEASQAEVVRNRLRRGQLAPQLYSFVQTFYQGKFGPAAGWAQAALFMQAVRRVRRQA